MAHTRVTITIECDTEAFQPWHTTSDEDQWERDNARNEQVGHILRKLAESVYNDGESDDEIRDENAELVGHIEFQQVDKPRAKLEGARNRLTGAL